MKRILSIIFLFTMPLYLLAQSNISNLEKYWYYRDRFDKYFVTVGTAPRESLVFSNRNKYGW